MKHKWQFYIIGLLSGILISGMALAIFFSIKNQTGDPLPFDNEANVIDAGSDAADSSNPAEEIAGKINLNQSTVDQLMELPNIGETKARAIVEFREKYGNFENVNELLYVPGIGDSVLEGLKDLVYVY
jgi:competence ComEA-like helix-hairpin-helix protein